ncbi:MAG TPA: ribonuclease HII [Pyrinomonadaceae bacterium]
MSSPVEQLLSEPLNELKKRLLDEHAPVPMGLLEALDADPRRGARELARKIRERRQRNRLEAQRLRKLHQYEGELWRQGLTLIAGVDEAGMAPLAGPVVAAAVILPRNYKLRGLNDSKKILDAARRSEMAEQIKREARCWSVGRAEVEEIDRLNIYHAGLLAMRRAVEALSIQPDYALVDARKIPECPCPQRGIIHGDTLSASIAAASIIAKTTRDAYMIELDRQYPGYGLASHKGYPTPAHYCALKTHGVLPIHRRSFSPVRLALQELRSAKGGAQIEENTDGAMTVEETADDRRGVEETINE